MQPEQIFAIANVTALATWVLLVFAGRRRWMTHIAALAAAALFAAAYTAIIAARWGSRTGDFSTLSGVAALFGDRWLLLAGWLHYLAFDLLVGRFEVIDARERGIPVWLVVPCLFLTFMFGPAGWLAYLALRLAFSALPAARAPSP
jgi:hypothetical protein